jgi:hypothetical protein
MGNRILITTCLLTALIGVVWGITKPAVVETVVIKTNRIDENLWVSRQAYVNEKELVRRLSERNSQLSYDNRLKSSQIESLVAVAASLRLKTDSLSALPREIVFDNGITSVDTVFTTVYGDSLLQVDATVTLTPEKLTHQQFITQLRPIKLDIITVNQPDGTLVYVESGDLEVENIEAFITTKPPRFKWWHYALGGAATGVIITNIFK